MKKNCGVPTTILVAIMAPLLFDLCQNFGNSHALTEEMDQTKIYHHAAVAAGQLECSEVGRDILKAGGNAVDAAIAVILCQGVVEPYFSGIGGGCIMTIYNSSTKSTTSIISRERAPSAATRDMFLGMGNNKHGAKFIAVPGELKGLEYAYNKYGGNLCWDKLFQPAIDKARNGFKVSGQMAIMLKYLYDKVIIEDPDSIFCDVYCNEDKSGVKQEGDIVKNPLLADTLEKIQKQGVDVFYSGEIADSIIHDIQSRGGIMTKQDLLDYTVIEKSTIKMRLPNGDHTMHAPPLPSGGPVVAAILSVMDLFDITLEEFKRTPTLQYHRTDEAFRHAFGARYSMGDPAYDQIALNIQNQIVSGQYARSVRTKIFDDKTFHDPAYYGAKFLDSSISSTLHISVLDPEGNAVALTSTIDYYWGSRIMSSSTGIVFNNEMADFSYPNGDSEHDSELSATNQIEGGKIPLSSMTPAMFLNDNDDLAFIIGASGGTRIPAAIATVILKFLYFGENDIGSAIKDKRFFDALIPDVLYYDAGFDDEIIQNLKKIGHNVRETTYTGRVNAIKCNSSAIYAFSDLRDIGAGPSGW
uniref:glutathione hydrolase 1 proenzyme-like isoform X1 n=2 Tax=Styela clava TaxID=7725 RepID=UPI00193A893A|nr:glutathione hydrolase 1 proenzyme-like isoform X1 [Styela clava]